MYTRSRRANSSRPSGFRPVIVGLQAATAHWSVSYVTRAFNIDIASQEWEYDPKGGGSVNLLSVRSHALDQNHGVCGTSESESELRHRMQPPVSLSSIRASQSCNSIRTWAAEHPLDANDLAAMDRVFALLAEARDGPNLDLVMRAARHRVVAQARHRRRRRSLRA